MRDYLGRRAGYIAIVLAILSLASIVVAVNYPYQDNKALIQWTSLFNVGSIQNAFFYRSVPNQFFGLTIRIFGITFLLMLLAGGISNLRSKGKANHLLKFCFLVIAASILIGYLFFLATTLGQVNDRDLELFDLVGLLVSAAIFYVAYQIYFYFRDNESVAISLETSKPLRISKLQRLVHYLFDLFLALNIIGFNLSLFFRLLSKTDLPLYAIKSILFTLAMLIYYLVCEIIFKSTPIKCLTGARIVRENTSTDPTIGQFVQRSFSRLIPFETLSFLGTKGWHDSISETEVVKIQNRPNSIVYLLWPLLLLGYFIGVNNYENLTKSLEKKKPEYIAKEKANQAQADNLSIYNTAVRSRSSRTVLGEGDFVSMDLEKVRDQPISGIGQILEINGDTAVLGFKKTKATEKLNAVVEYEKSSIKNETLKVHYRRLQQRQKLNVIDEFFTVEVKDFHYPHLFYATSTKAKLLGNNRDTLSVEIRFEKHLKSLRISEVQGPIEWVSQSIDHSGKTTTINLKAHYSNSEKSYVSTLYFNEETRPYKFLLTGYEEHIKVFQGSN